MNDLVQTLDDRIARARSLIEEHPAASEPLRFYADLTEHQKSLLSARPEGCRAERLEAEPLGGSFRGSLDLEPALRSIPDFLSWLAEYGPSSLADAASPLRARDSDFWRSGMRSYLESGPADASEADRTSLFVVAAVLQPFVEQAALGAQSRRAEESSGGSRPLESPANCPGCGGLPVLGVLRQEGHGARRSLVCSLCLTEHDYMRVVCPACGERKFEALPIYTAAQFEYVRIEACDSCRTYLKTIDLTRNGLAVPVVDDIASVSLDLWARERGYSRLQPNLLAL